MKFSGDPDDYLPQVLTRWEGTELFNYSPFIYSYQAVNVALTGEGVLDGNTGEGFANWRPMQHEAKMRLREMCEARSILNPIRTVFNIYLNIGCPTNLISVFLLMLFFVSAKTNLHHEGETSGEYLSFYFFSRTLLIVLN